MTWAWVALTVGGTPTGELTAATDRKVTWRLRDAGEASWSTVDQDQAEMTPELRSDLMVLFDGQPLWRGRVGPSSDDGDGTTHTSTFSAVDYRGVLARRVMHTPIDFGVVDMAAAAWTLIDYTQHNALLPPGGPLGISEGDVAAIASRALSVPSGKWVAEAIDDLSDTYPGFDWWVDPDMLFHAVRARGRERDLTLTYGSTATGFTRQFDPTGYANVIHQTGKDGLVAAIRWAPDLGTTARPEGRWEHQEGNPDLSTQALVDAAADGLLIRRAALTPAWKVTVRPGVWTPDRLWLGDLTRLRIRSGRLDVDTIDRVTEITVAGDDDPTVEITVGGPFRQDFAHLLRQIPPRLTQLARR